jgi:hypothetical protein
MLLRASSITSNATLRWLPMIWLYLVILLWHRISAGSLTIVIASVLFSILLASVLTGDLFVKWVLKDSEKFSSLPAKLLAGLLCVNLFLFIASLVFPFGLTIDWIILVALILSVWLRARPAGSRTLISAKHPPEIIFILTAPVLVTVWCRELLLPAALEGKVVVIRAWLDIYYHLCQISMFASSTGIGTITDVQMGDAPATPYHMASYLLPALLVNAGGSSAIVAYASLLVPLGLLMTALAAFSLGHVAFGRWPALTAGLGLLLLPDAMQQGVNNPYFGYHWLQQVSPSLCYGVASAAFVFMLMFEASRTNQYRLAIWGYAFVLVTLLYKAQIFVAISFLAFVFPVLFIRGRIAGYRIPLFLVFTCVYIAVVSASQNAAGVPTMRMDGSGLAPYSDWVLALQLGGFFQQFFYFLFGHAGTNWYSQAAAFLVVLVISTFGIFSVIYIALLARLKRLSEPAVWLFPLLVIAVYLAMGIGLAMDERHIGGREELLHRPFVWAYFVLVVWCAGAACRTLAGNSTLSGKRAKWGLILLAVGLTPIPVIFSTKIQTFDLWKITQQELPPCLVDAARYIRENSHPNELVQDAMNDRRLILSALSERKPFAVDSGGFRAPAGMAARLESLKQLKKKQDSAQVASFMEEHAIKWYVVGPESAVQWPEAMMKRSAFACGDYRVYRF